MSRRRTSKFTWLVLILMVVGVVLFGWSMFFPHVEEPSGTVSASKAASFASISIPAAEWELGAKITG